MSITRFIGDVHGKFGPYKKIIESSPYPTVQVGDMGVGFKNIHEEYLQNPPYLKMVENNARFIRGNHDNPDVCKKHTQCIMDGTMETTSSGTKIMYVGGAWSIDGNQRIPNLSWWQNEELSSQEFDKVLVDYMTFAPDVVITHDCPQSVAYELFIKCTSRPVYKTRTAQAFDAMLSLHKPKLWCFGHWHLSRSELINGTRFVCLAELETLDVNL